MKYSALTDVNAANVQRLQLAWQWKHWETPLEEYKTAPGFFESTPLMIDGVLYVTTPYNSIAALDAETGRELWRFDGEAYKLGQLLSSSGWKLRGTGFWRDGGKLRVFLNSRHRLFALDALTGKPVSSFGTGGVVSLTDGLSRISDIKHATESSPPVVYQDLVVGSQVPDRVRCPIRSATCRRSMRAPATSVDVLDHSAIQVGSRRGDVGARVVADERARQRLGADDARCGSWYSTTDVDTEQRLLRRRAPGANLFAESLVCLDVNRARSSGIFKPCTTGSGITTNPRRRTW